MKTKEQETQEFINFLNSLKGAKVTYNPELDKREHLVLFPEKLRKAKETIARVGMPKEYYEQMAKKNKEKEE
jgi:hypothetical protein